MYKLNTQNKRPKKEKKYDKTGQHSRCEQSVVNVKESQWLSIKKTKTEKRREMQGGDDDEMSSLKTKVLNWAVVNPK